MTFRGADKRLVSTAEKNMEINRSPVNTMRWVKM
jgi:hypothetical protein